MENNTSNYELEKQAIKNQINILQRTLDDFESYETKIKTTLIDNGFEFVESGCYIKKNLILASTKNNEKPLTYSVKFFYNNSWIWEVTLDSDPNIKCKTYRCFNLEEAYEDYKTQEPYLVIGKIKAWTDTIIIPIFDWENFCEDYTDYLEFQLETPS